MHMMGGWPTFNDLCVHQSPRMVLVNARKIKGPGHPPIYGCVAGFAVKMPLKLSRY
jgi:hypothetical protein